jgi:hypothetical protein
MDARQQAHFRAKGYLVVPAAITPAHVAALNGLYDARVQAEVVPAAAQHAAATGGLPYICHGFAQQEAGAGRQQGRGGGQQLWGQAFYDLLDPAAVLPIVRELLGDPQWEHCLGQPDGRPPGGAGDYPLPRLDHANAHWIQPFDPSPLPPPRYPAGERLPKSYWSAGGIVRGGLHGGQPGRLQDQRFPAWYPNQGELWPFTILGSLISCLYELLPVEPGCGGTVVFAGSHRADHPRPPPSSYAHHTLLPEGEAAQNTHHLPPWPPEWREQYGMETVQVQPGECLIFSEKLLHATAPYTGRRERRTVFCKYVPADAAPNPDPQYQYDAVGVAGLTPTQRSLLSRPVAKLIGGADPIPVDHARPAKL